MKVREGIDRGSQPSVFKLFVLEISLNVAFNLTLGKVHNVPSYEEATSGYLSQSFLRRIKLPLNRTEETLK